MTSMQMLYHSEFFVVVHMQSEVPRVSSKSQNTLLQQTQLVRSGFEIVDKRSGKEIYLDGTWADLFQKKITSWQKKTPTQEEVESTLDSYATLAQNPIVTH